MKSQFFGCIFASLCVGTFGAFAQEFSATQLIPNLQPGQTLRVTSSVNSDMDVGLRHDSTGYLLQSGVALGSVGLGNTVLAVSERLQDGHALMLVQSSNYINSVVRDDNSSPSYQFAPTGTYKTLALNGVVGGDVNGQAYIWDTAGNGTNIHSKLLTHDSTIVTSLVQGISHLRGDSLAIYGRMNKSSSPWYFQSYVFLPKTDAFLILGDIDQRLAQASISEFILDPKGRVLAVGSFLENQVPKPFMLDLNSLDLELLPLLSGTSGVTAPAIRIGVIPGTRTVLILANLAPTQCSLSSCQRLVRWNYKWSTAASAYVASSQVSEVLPLTVSNAPIYTTDLTYFTNIDRASGCFVATPSISATQSFPRPFMFCAN